jgi:hypothetical protein
MWLADSARALSLCGPLPPDCLRYTCVGSAWEEIGFKSAGTACNDRSACTTGDHCDGQGTCVGTPLAGINDSNPCTTDSCNVSTGAITHTPITGACCSAGVAVTNSCCTGGVAKVNGTACPDGNLCNGAETCQAGVCTTGTPLVVDDGNPCTADSCNPATGAITHASIASACCANGLSRSGQVCRVAKGACDPGAVCIATSPDCPVSQAPVGTVCAMGVLTSSCKCASDGYCRTDRSRTDVWYDVTANIVSQKRLGVGEACE